ncbi:MAG: hypothetical protein RL094_594 [Candidatus Parcubacteria bacterium]|jgi:cysteine desulfurase
MKFFSLFKPSNMFSKKRLYFDYASITPVDPRVADVMAETMQKYAANPASLYAEGVAAKKAMDTARVQVADLVEAHDDEIIFTSGGTEANNLAIKGVLQSAAASAQFAQAKPHIVTTAIEHPSIFELVEVLGKNAVDVTVVPVMENGIVDPKEIKQALRPETVLVSVMYANNEIGTIQPIAETAKAIRAFKKEKGIGSHGYPYLHTDASQAAAYCSLRIPALNVDLLTLDGSKIYGPRGTGMLFVRRGVQIQSQMIGGSQESDRRAGTENLPGITGFALALSLSEKEKEQESARVAEMRDWLLSEIQKAHPHVVPNGDLEKRLPNNINVCIPEADGEFLVLKLDVRGIAVSSVTSCRNLSEDSSSYVIEAIGKPHCAKSSLRITLGRYTRTSDLPILLNALKEVIK